MHTADSHAHTFQCFISLAFLMCNVVAVLKSKRLHEIGRTGSEKMLLAEGVPGGTRI